MLGVLRAALPGAAFAQQQLLPPISLWALDETSDEGGVFSDLGPANVPMTIAGTWTDLSTNSIVQGVGGTSAHTNGSGYATIPANHPAHDLSALTVSFYYQRNSAAAKHILLAAGDGSQAGDFSIEVLENGRLRGYHVGQDAQLRFFESTNGITGTDLQAGTAHRIDLTLGFLGARIYLDGAPLINAFILANTNGWNNGRTKYLGRWIDGVQAPAVGVFDRVRLWDRQLSATEIAVLEPAQSLAFPFVDVGALQAFTRSTIDVTARSGWPAGRIPKAIVTQGTRASGYIRRPWKPALNNGNYIDFIPGWQKTTGQESIRLQLDDNSEIELRYTVEHTVPAPTGGGVTRTLDRTGAGGAFTTWAAAVAALTSGDVLVVRAPAGTWTDSGGHAIPNYVYDVTTNVTPSSGVSNVTVIAHPDDVAAGRRPVLWRNAGRYARFKYAASAAWQLHASLAGGLSVWESVATSTEPAHSYFGAYRDQAGDWISMYICQPLNTGTNFTGVLHDTSYPGNNRSNINTYMGPSICFNRSTTRWEVRVSPPVKQTYMNPNNNTLPWPPWNWTKHYAPSEDARNCEIVITDGGTSGSPNMLLDLSGSRNGWKFYNIDFIYGNRGITAESTPTMPNFFGCSFLGGATPEFVNDTSGNVNYTSTFIWSVLSSIPNSDAIYDRCTLHGGMPPWTDFNEGKRNDGAPGTAVRRDFQSWSYMRSVFRFCKIVNWWQFTWLGDFNTPRNPIKWHVHHSLLRGFGMDGAMIAPPGNCDFNMNRNFMPSAQIYGYSGISGTGNRYHTFNVELRLSTIMAGAPGLKKWAHIAGTVESPAFVHAQTTNHGEARSDHQERKFYNTCVGSQNCLGAQHTVNIEGCGSGIGTDTRGTNHRIYNCIGAVYPGHPWPIGKSALVGLYTREGGNSQYDFNVLFKSAGMPVPSFGSNTFFGVNTGSEAGVTGYGSLAAMQSGEGFDLNSIQADPQFVVTPAWASSNPYAAGGVFDMANYMLAAGSPCRTGARNLNDQSFPDYDFETLTTWAGGTNAPWRGALQPDVPVHEQEVGIVGPLPPEIV